MKCKKCDGKGYIEGRTRRHAGDFGQIFQCCDVAKYSAEVRRRFMPEVKPAHKLENPFRLVETKHGD